MRISFLSCWWKSPRFQRPLRGSARPGRGHASDAKPIGTRTTRFSGTRNNIILLLKFEQGWNLCSVVIGWFQVAADISLPLKLNYRYPSPHPTSKPEIEWQKPSNQNLKKPHQSIENLKTYWKRSRKQNLKNLRKLEMHQSLPDNTVTNHFKSCHHLLL